jgi:putative transposase
MATYKIQNGCGSSIEAVRASNQKRRRVYIARNEKKDPVQALRRKIRSDQGLHPALSPKLGELLATQYRQHPNWSYQLHTDNLVVLVEKEPTLGAPPSYTSVLRFMRDHGLVKRPRRGPVYSPGAQATEHRIESREIRSYESQSGKSHGRTPTAGDKEQALVDRAARI